MPPSETCGHDPTGTFPDGRLGCGQPIETCAEVYRCTDCTVPFHRQCAQGHFGDAKRNYVELAMRHEKLKLEARAVAECFTGNGGQMVLAAPGRTLEDRVADLRATLAVQDKMVAETAKRVRPSK